MNDAGAPVEIDDYDETARSVMNFVRNGVDPDMSALVTVTPLVVDGKTIALTWIFHLGRRLKAHLGFA